MVDENQAAALLTGFNSKLADLEEKYHLLRDRVMIGDESFLKNFESIRKAITLIKDELREIKNELETLKERTGMLIDEMANVARKDEVAVIERYMKLWEPLKFVRHEDIRELREELKKKKDIEK